MSIRQRILSKFGRNRPLMEEVAAAQSRLASSAYRLAAYSPDDLLSRKGLAVYDEMQKDSQVLSCLNTKKFAVLSKGWDVVPADGSQANIRSAEFVKFCL